MTRDEFKKCLAATADISPSYAAKARLDCLDAWDEVHSIASAVTQSEAREGILRHKLEERDILLTNRERELVGFREEIRRLNDRIAEGLDEAQAYVQEHSKEEPFYSGLGQHVWGKILEDAKKQRARVEEIFRKLRELGRTKWGSPDSPAEEIVFWEQIENIIEKT